MKNVLLFGTALLLGTGIIGSGKMYAQDKKSEMQITIREGGKVTSDTSFILDEDQDPEMIRKVIAVLAGGEQKMMVHHSSKDDFVLHGPCDMLDLETELGFDIDSLKEAHGGAKVMVIKKEDGTVEVTELTGDCDETVMLDGMAGHKVIRMEIEEEHEGPHSHSKMHKSANHVMMFSDEDDCEGEKTIIIKTIGDDDKVEVTKHITVTVETDDDSDGKDKTDRKTDKKKSVKKK